MEEHQPPTLRELYPDLTEAELAETEDRLERYLALVLRIFERPSYPQPSPGSPDIGTLSCTPRNPDAPAD